MTSSARKRYVFPINPRIDQSLHLLALTKPQVQKLSNLFRDDFRFDVEHTLLNNAKPPQHQLNAAISNFVLNHDHPNNLLLIYYAGHGLFSENEKKLILAGLVDITSM